MTARFKTALAALIGLAATAVVVALLLGVFDNQDPDTGETHIADETGTPDQPTDGPLTATDGGTDERPGLDGTGTGTSGTGAVRPGMREPHGLDLTDPEQVAKHLANLVGEDPVDWKELLRTLKVAKPPLSDEIKAFLLKTIRFGPRNYASRAFAVVQDGSLATDLLAMLDEGTLDTRGNLAVLRALREMPGANANEVALGLEARLTDDYAKDTYVIQAIAARGGPEATRALIEYIQRMEKPGLMNPYLLQGLNLKDDPEAQKVVLDALSQSDITPDALRQVLGMVKQPGATEFSKSVIALDADAQDEKVRMEAIKTLAKIGGEDAVRYLITKSAEPGAYGEHATKALKNLNHMDAETQKTVADQLAGASRNPRPDAYTEALLLALGNVRASNAAERILPFIDHPSNGVSHAAIRAIGRMQEGGEKHVPILIKRWSTADEPTRLRLGIALGTIGGKEAVGAMEQMVTDQEISPALLRTLRMGLNDAKKRLEAPASPSPGDEGGLVGQARPMGGGR